MGVHLEGACGFAGAVIADGFSVVLVTLGVDAVAGALPHATSAFVNQEGLQPVDASVNGLFAALFKDGGIRKILTGTVAEDGFGHECGLGTGDPFRNVTDDLLPGVAGSEAGTVEVMQAEGGHHDAVVLHEPQADDTSLHDLLCRVIQVGMGEDVLFIDQEGFDALRKNIGLHEEVGVLVQQVPGGETGDTLAVLGLHVDQTLPRGVIEGGRRIDVLEIGNGLSEHPLASVGLGFQAGDDAGVGELTETKDAEGIVGGEVQVYGLLGGHAVNLGRTGFQNVGKVAGVFGDE